jgi:ECF sigma factor
VKTGPWLGDEYKVLHEGGDPAEIAAALGRDVEEVRGKIESSLAGWYRLRRCPGSPERPDSIRSLAWRIWEEDGFCNYITDGEFEEHLFEQLEMCFLNFRAEKWPEEIDEPVKFTKYFRACWKKRMRRAVIKSRRLSEVIPATSGARPGWPRALLRASLAKFGKADRKFVEMRFLEGLGVAEIGERLGLATRTLYNRYSISHVVAMVREAIGRIPERVVETWAAHLEDQVGLSRSAISEVLCLPERDVERLLAPSQSELKMAIAG